MIPSHPFLCALGNDHEALGLYYIRFLMFFSVPQLLYLRARALQNLSLLIEWQLEYDGGFPVSNFLITVRVQLPRQHRNTPEFPHFEVSIKFEYVAYKMVSSYVTCIMIGMYMWQVIPSRISITLLCLKRCITELPLRAHTCFVDA